MSIRFSAATTKFLASLIGLEQCSRASRIPVRSFTRSFRHSVRLFNDDDSDNRPHMYHLEHIQKRVEECVTLMFRRQLDFSFYRKDVVFDNQILNIRMAGRDNYVIHLSAISMVVNLLLPYAELQALNIIPLLDDGTVRLRWRIRYQGWLTALSWTNFMHKLDFESSLKWFDGYSIFYVDGNGLVYKVTFQKCMPNDDKKITPKRIAQKIVEKAHPATTTPSTSTKL